MKNVLMAAALAGAIGGVVGSIAMKRLGAAPQTMADEVSGGGLTPEVHASPALWESELADLRQQNAELSLRLIALESRRLEVAPGPDSVDGDALLEVQESVAALAAALKNPQSASSAGLRQIVAVALEEVQAVQAEERRSARDQREIDRIVERMGDYTEKLGLDAVQRQSMQDALIDAGTKRNELFTSMRDGSIPREDIRDAFTRQREDSEAALSRILSPEQMESYGEMNPERGGFMGRGGGRRSGRGQ